MASLPIFVKYLITFFISMVPIVELRGAIPIAESLGLNIFIYYPVAIIGNMLPVPIIYLFARKVLEWGKDKKVIGKFFTWCLEKGEKGGEKFWFYRQNLKYNSEMNNSYQNPYRSPVYFLLYFYLLEYLFLEQALGPEL